MVRKLIPEEIRLDAEKTDDFQDIELWRVLTVEAAKEVKKKYKKHLIVPMTIYKADNFDYIYNGFREIDEELLHFCLYASEETIYKRLAKRGDVIGGWQYQQAPKCVKALIDVKFQEHIFTDQLQTFEIIEIMLERIKKKRKTY